MKKIYIAGPLCTEENRKFLEEIDRLCKNLGFKTFLPHRDAGLFRKLNDIPKISKKDLEELKNCDILIGILDGICVGAGTAWEMGFFQALGKKVIGLKTDRKINESIPEISTIIAGQVEIAESLEELKKELYKII
jgi:nucleoside 2-deoxyribosyltransferase